MSNAIRYANRPIAFALLRQFLSACLKLRLTPLTSGGIISLCGELVLELDLLRVQNNELVEYMYELQCFLSVWELVKHLLL
eukprot:scaffold200079_cov59-Attheya_sp.AAC.2